MGQVFLLHLGRKVVLFGTDLKEVDSWDLPRGDAVAELSLTETTPKSLTDWMREVLRKFPGAIVRTEDRLCRRALDDLKIPYRPVPDPILARIRQRTFFALPPPAFIRRARAALQAHLRSPEEQIVLLSREADRLERLVRREEEYGQRLSLSATPESAVFVQARRSSQLKNDISQILGDVEHDLETETRRLLPNTVAALGSRTAARLLAESGGLRVLSRFSASRVQLIGSRRRSPGRPPKFGLLYRAEGMERIPPDRQGAMARSLGALTVVALHADLLTHQDRTAWVRTKKERRMLQLQSHGRRSS